MLPNLSYTIGNLKYWFWAHEFTNLLAIIAKLIDCIFKFLFLLGCPVNHTWFICTFILNMVSELFCDGCTTSSFYMFGNFRNVSPVLIQCPLKSLNFIRFPVRFPVSWILPWHRLFLVVLRLSLWHLFRFKRLSFVCFGQYPVLVWNWSALTWNNSFFRKLLLLLFRFMCL